MYDLRERFMPPGRGKHELACATYRKIWAFRVLGSRCPPQCFPAAEIFMQKSGSFGVYSSCAGCWRHVAEVWRRRSGPQEINTTCTDSIFLVWAAFSGLAGFRLEKACRHIGKSGFRLTTERLNQTECGKFARFDSCPETPDSTFQTAVNHNAL